MEYTAFAPEILIGAFALAAPAVWYIVRSSRLLACFTLTGTVLAALATLNLAGVFAPFGKVFYQVPANIYLFSNTLRIDLFSIFFKFVFLVVAGLVVLASAVYTRGEHQGEYYALLLFAVLGMCVLASSTDLITLFIGLELASVASYALVAYKKDRTGAETATKYFIIGAFSSAFTLYAISLVYGVAGTTNLYTMKDIILSSAIKTEPVLLISLVLLVAGLGFKIAAVPFHMWAPDVYQGAPTPITALLAGASKKLGFAAIFKIFLIGLVAVKADWKLALALVSVLTMTLANLIALSQTDIKRMLAYSSIAHAGYILISLPVAARCGPIGTYALGGGLYHIFTHAVMVSGAFIGATLVALSLGYRLEDYKGLGKNSPFVALCLTIILLSLAGIPPFGGFVSKFVLFSAAVYAGGWLILLAVAGVLNSALSLYYYARVIKYMYVEEPRRTGAVQEPTALIFALAVATVLVILSGIYPGPFIQAAMSAAGALI